MATAKLNADEIAEKIGQLSRQPFREQAALMLECAPSQEAIKAWAPTHIDRYWQSMAIVGKLAGYNERLEVEATLDVRIDTMSDSELQAAVDAKLKALNDTLDFPSKGHSS